MPCLPHLPPLRIQVMKINPQLVKFIMLFFFFLFDKPNFKCISFWEIYGSVFMVCVPGNSPLNLKPEFIVCIDNWNLFLLEIKCTSSIINIFLFRWEVGLEREHKL